MSTACVGGRCEPLKKAQPTGLRPCPPHQSAQRSELPWPVLSVTAATAEALCSRPPQPGPGSPIPFESPSPPDLCVWTLSCGHRLCERAVSG